MVKKLIKINGSLDKIGSISNCSAVVLDEGKIKLYSLKSEETFIRYDKLAAQKGWEVADDADHETYRQLRQEQIKKDTTYPLGKER